MKDSNIVVGVDIGTAKISTIIAQVGEDSVNIIGASEIQSRGVRKGQIVDIQEAAGALNESLNTAERMAGYSIDRVFCSISGTNIESQNSKGIVAVSHPEGEIESTDIDRVLEAAGAISLPSSRNIIHVFPRIYTVDGETGIKDPTGMNGVRLEVDTHIITANTTTVKNIDKVLESEAGVGLNSLVFSGIASSLAVLTETEKELGVVLLDIGGGITNICVFVEGALSYSGVLPIGAKHVTNDLAIGLRVSLESAEKIKVYLSSKYNHKGRKTETEDGEKESDSDEIDLGFLGLSEDVKKVSKKTLIEGIIRPRLNEIFTLVSLELKKSGFLTQTPAGIVLTGGGAKTIGIKESAKRMLAMPVRIGAPYNITGLIDDIQEPVFATCVGLVLFSRQFKGNLAGGGVGFLSSFSFSFLSNFISLVKKLLKNFIP